MVRNAFIIFAMSVAMCAAGSVATAADAPVIDFRKQVVPIFTKYCTGCHNATEENGELNLAAYKTLMLGGENGAVIVPGQPEKSRLILSLEKKIEPFMPPEDEKAPTAAEIAILKAWIKAGAKAPVGSELAPLSVPKVKVVGQPRKPIHAVAFSPDAKRIAVARYANVELLSAGDRKSISTVAGMTGQVNDVGFSHDGRLMFAAAGEPGLFGEATLWDATSGKRLHTLRGHADCLYAADVNNAGTILATAGYDQAIKLWDVKTGTELRTLNGHNGAIFDLAFHPSGKFLASASGDFTVKLWDVATGKRLDTRNEPTKGQNTVCFSPDGKWLAAGGIDNRIRVWRMTKRGAAEITYSRFAHDAPILKLVFSPDGRQLISSAEDRTIKVWETGEFTQVAVLMKQPDWVAALAVSPDNKGLLVGRMDGTLATYPLGVKAGGGDSPQPVSDVVVSTAPSGKPVKLAEIKEVEPNNQTKQATLLSVPAHADGVLMSADPKRADVDLYRFDAKQGQVWIVETRAARDKSPADTKIEILHADGRPVERLRLRAVRDSYIKFRPINSAQLNVRVKNWEEMELNQFMYLNGEICKLFRMPRGPDSGFQLYDVGGKRHCYFDTSATSHAKDEPAYIVEPFLPGTKLADNGLPIFPLYFANDDDGERKLGNDSKLTFTAPADGTYLVRVTDVRGIGGKDFKYRLTVRHPQPDFALTIGGMNATVGVGSGQRLTFKLDRKDNFNGPVRIDVTGLPAGFTCPSPLVIEPGHLEARGVISASAKLVAPQKESQKKDAKKTASKQPPQFDWSKVLVTATAKIGDREVTKLVGNLGTIKLAARPKVIVHLTPDNPDVSPSTGELVIAPGTTITAMLSIERHGYNGDLKFDVDNLPHGVIVDDIGLSGILVRADETRRQIFLTAADWVPETTRTFHAVSQGQGNLTSRTLILHVRRAGKLAANSK
jgi:WD40 repeat protein